jgi:hypothetical protein
MKKSFLIMVALIFFTTFAFAGGDQNQNRHDGELGEGATQQQRIANPNIDALQVTQLDVPLKELIYSIYEEEKVARDVYITLGELYPDENTFANIQLSEQNHMDAVRKLCVKYGIEIPADDQPVGVFDLTEMGELYSYFVDLEDDSLISALQVGIAIENMDIENLREALNTEGMPKDAIRVLNNLLNGSLNHLDAFEAAYEREALQ